MNNYVRSVTGLLLVAIMLSMLLPMPFISPVRTVKASPVQPQREQEELPKQLAPGAYKGEAVRRRINALRATNKALNRAMKDKEKIGKTVNWELSAVLVFPEAKKKQVAKLSLPKMAASFAPAQETLSDGTGEATFITYNGPDNTWDGTISVTDYYTGENYVYNGEMWDFGATNDPAVWDVTYEAYYPPDGSDPVECPANGHCMIQPSQVKNNEAGSSAASQMVKASYSPTMKSASPPGFIFRWFSSYWRCFSRTAAFIGRVCVSPQPNIRNSLICAMAAGVYAAGCCARFSGQNSGQGRCYP
jgi:hypothetical protein